MGTDLGKYDQFRMKFDPSYKTQSTGDGINIAWPDETTQFQAAAVEEDDDLYS